MRHISASCADLLPARGRIVVFAESPSLRDGAGASERLAGLAVIEIERESRAVAPNEPSARSRPELIEGHAGGRTPSPQHASSSKSSPPRQRRGGDEHGGTGVEEQG